MRTADILAMVRPKDDGHDWLSLKEEDGTDWLFDVTFLLSGFRCIYGAGCQSIAPESNTTNMLGCCTHGAHLVDDEDLAAVNAAIEHLTGDDWQFKGRSDNKGGPLKQKKSGDWVTRKAKGACIFLNRPEFPGGAGCALHRAALRSGARPIDWKPDVCWQVPIRLDVHEDDYENQTVFVRAWQRSDWGPGGEELGWWCIEDHEPYKGAEPLYRSARAELEEMIGADLYHRLQNELHLRETQTPVELTKA